MKEVFDRAWEAIEQANRCTVVSHPKPDGDTTGAALAFYHVLSDLGKDVSAFCVDSPALNLPFLPGVEVYSTDPTALQSSDCVIVFDAGDLEFLQIGDLIPKDATIINVDHHSSNTHFGAINIVDTDASATCEVVYTMLNERGQDIPPAIATCLLTGIVTDTGGFYNAATTPHALRVASELTRMGATFRTIMKQTLQQKSVSCLRIWGVALERLKTDPETDIVTTYITYEDLCDAGAEFDDLKELSSFIASSKSSRAVYLYVHNDDGTVKASLRTTRDDVDVASIAKSYGGGGHPKAAGFLVDANIVDTPTGWQLILKDSPTSA